LQWKFATIQELNGCTGAIIYHKYTLPSQKRQIHVLFYHTAASSWKEGKQMPVFKDEERNAFYVKTYYTDYIGAKKAENEAGL
jgi:replicative superfamily II helicase